MYLYQHCIIGLPSTVSISTILLSVLLLLCNQIDSSLESVDYYNIPAYHELDFTIPVGNPKDFPCIQTAHASSNQCYNSIREDWSESPSESPPSPSPSPSSSSSSSSISNEKSHCCFLLNYLDCLTSSCSADDLNREKRFFARMRQNWLKDKCPNYYHMNDCSISKWTFATIILTIILIILLTSFAISFICQRNRRKKAFGQRPVELS